MALFGNETHFLQFSKTTCSPGDPPIDLQNVKNSPEPPSPRTSSKMGSKPTNLIRDENIQFTATTCTEVHSDFGTASCQTRQYTQLTCRLVFWCIRQASRQFLTTPSPAHDGKTPVMCFHFALCDAHHPTGSLYDLCIDMLAMTMTMTMTHSEKSHIGQMRAWPYRQERRGHGPTKKNLSYR